MKKTLSWILALMIIVSTFSCIGVVASAEAGGIRYFTVTLAKDEKVLPAQEEYELDFKSESSYLEQCYEALFAKGTEIRIFYTDNTEKVFASDGEGAFVNGKNDFLSELLGMGGEKIYRDVMFIDEVNVYGTEDDHFVVCLTNGLRHSVKVDVINYPKDFPLGIIYEPAADIELTENCCGYYLADNTFIYEPASIAQYGDNLHLYYYGRGFDTYTFDGEGWYNEDGNKMPGKIAIDQLASFNEQVAVGGWVTDGYNFMPLAYSYKGQSVSTIVDVNIIESDFISAEYIADTPVEVYEESCGYFGDNGNYIYNEELCLAVPGNEIVLTYDDGTEAKFYYDEFGNLLDEFDTLVDETHVYYTSKQDVNPWVLGSGNEGKVRMFGVEATVDVTVVENPIASIEFKSEDVLRVVTGVDSKKYTNVDGDTAYYYDCSNILYTEGNEVTINFKDGSSKIYSFVGDDYVSADGKALGMRFFEVVTEQDYSDKEWFENRIYSATIIYKGVMTDVPVKVVPKNAPSKPEIRLNNGEKGVVIRWDLIDTAETYNVYRRLSGSEKWSLIGSTYKAKYTDKTAKHNKKYDYSVRAKNDQGLSKRGIATTTYFKAPEITEVVNLAKGIRVEWDPVKGATSYRVYRKIDGASSWKLITETEELVFVDKSIVNATGTEYTYTVRAMKNKIYGAYDVSGKSVIRIAKPYVKSAEKTDDGILITWKATVGAEEYYVYRKNLNAEKQVWKKIGTVVGKNNTTFLDTKADKEGYYRYTVRAYAKGTMSSFMLGPIYGVPDKPVLTKVANKYSGVQLTWESAKRADTYNVYRKVKGGSWTLIAEGIKKTTYTDKNAPNGKYVYYTVSGVNEVGEGSYNTKGLMRYFVKAPVLKSATYTEEDGVKLQWNKVSGAEEYRVYRRTAGGSWKLVKTTSRTTFYDENVKSDSYYVYTVRAVRNNWYSGYNTKGIAVDTVEDKVIF